ncbi:MAG: T9SS type A sorting domain-containing protein [Muribaculaceae bacterium]|nr:T9SS type A sorting domain-containing protein [Muribaculaceae bacterium]
MLRYLLIAIIISASILTARSDTAWETLNTSVRNEQMVENDDIHISSHDGYVYLSTPHSTNVKIFSILGQVISQKDIKPGSYRIRLASKGIYILRAGSITRRITI